MNDLQTLRAALVPGEPAQDVVDRSRHRLQNRMLGAPRRRLRPLAIGTGLAAVAAAAAVVVATLPATPAPAPSPQAVAPVDTGRQILLAAATVAERTHVGTGKYWHTTTKVGNEAWEYWTTTDGQEWYRTARTGGKAVLASRPRPIRLTGAEVTLSQILALPTDPKALREWLAKGLAHNKYPAKERDMAVLDSLVMLVSTVPSPPAVRAAAFRAIADYPGVHALGTVPGGEGVELPGGGRLVVDPETGKVDGSSVFRKADGTPATNSDGDTYAVSAEWTDDLPK
ncbi:CU044_5270 family protein [Amycolatopsis sp. DG1A-15b]|uniref:CU044_5270 family protein n=1 Tax=Amycolatopsis sp. DG1A-15b TaxID=3052846 RepID=UPI00255B7D2B|nr:CU044_5270 family protein [Amycolatopsis sp. DG1A-15b]WIX86896.1 CU044_5270 family protein [Amycolatopsis sp. DG1A-15b]